MAAVPARNRAAFDAHWTAILRDPGVVARTVLAGDRLAGSVLSFLRDGERHIGYWIAREHWGRGIATAALARFLQELPDRPLHATVAAHNAGSLRVLEKCGFRRVGERRDGSAPVHVLRLD